MFRVVCIWEDGCIESYDFKTRKQADKFADELFVDHRIVQISIS